jgi:hypothetical protein
MNAWPESQPLLLPEIINRIPILAAVRNPFDCAALRTFGIAGAYGQLR